MATRRGSRETQEEVYFYIKRPPHGKIKTWEEIVDCVRTDRNRSYTLRFRPGYAICRVSEDGAIEFLGPIADLKAIGFSLAWNDSVADRHGIPKENRKRD